MLVWLSELPAENHFLGSVMYFNEFKLLRIWKKEDIKTVYAKVIHRFVHYVILKYVWWLSFNCWCSNGRFCFNWRRNELPESQNQLWAKNKPPTFSIFFFS